GSAGQWDFDPLGLGYEGEGEEEEKVGDQSDVFHLGSPLARWSNRRPSSNREPKLHPPTASAPESRPLIVYSSRATCISCTPFQGGTMTLRTLTFLRLVGL